jgi:hypothetical protein
LRYDFTISTYRHLLLSLQAAGYAFISFSDWCEGKADALNKYVILRHDIDKNPYNALKIAKIEAAMGIRSTYYWLTKKQVFKSSIIKEVAKLGHEIGYHYRDWVDAQGIPERALELFQHNLQMMQALVEVKTIAMDGCPWSKYNNRDLWKHFDYKSFGIIGEPYFDIFGVDWDAPVKQDVFYLTDTGRLWNGDKFSIRDKVANNQILDYQTTYALIEAVETDGLPYKIMITVHPQRWSDNVVEWLYEFIVQGIKNKVKGLLVKMKRL